MEELFKLANGYRDLFKRMNGMKRTARRVGNHEMAWYNAQRARHYLGMYRQLQQKKG